MRRNLGIFGHVVLLTASAFVALLWVRTVWFDDHLYLSAVTHGSSRLWKLCVRSRNDRITVEACSERATSPRDVAWLSERPRLYRNWSSNRRERGDNTWRPKKHVFLFERGFWWGRVPVTSGTEYRFTVPHWFSLLLAGWLPAVKAIRLCRVYRRHVRGLCPACGYDLRATPGRCPECGTDASESPSPAPEGREAEPAPPARAA
jgi:hypothetical protein